MRAFSPEENSIVLTPPAGLPLRMSTVGTGGGFGLASAVWVSVVVCCVVASAGRGGLL